MDTQTKFERARAMRSQPTDAEAALWRELYQHRGRYGYWQEQVVKRGYILDFYSRLLNICIEVDGGYHNSPRQQRYDANRARVLLTVGVKTIRFPNEQVLQNPEQCLLSVPEIARETEYVHTHGGRRRL